MNNPIKQSEKNIPWDIAGVTIFLLAGLFTIFGSFFEEVVPPLHTSDMILRIGVFLFFIAAAYFFISLVLLLTRKVSSTEADDADHVDGGDMRIRFKYNDPATHVLMSILLIIIACVFLTISVI
jgi:hypothetical protein